MAIQPSTVLRLAPDVSVRYRTGIDVEITLGAERIRAGPHGVAVLEAFRTATPMGEALQRLGERTSGMQDWIELSALITSFAKLGILRDPSTVEPTLNLTAGQFDAARVHVTMLDDVTRTQRYLSAIRQVVRPGDVVVEVGTGTGVLSVAAAQAGAARVYAIEASAIGDSARRVFEANGVADRVTLIEGLSSRVTLPEPCDVLIAEIIGRDPLEEDLLEFTRDAVARFLKPGARLIPSEFRIFALPVTLPTDVRRNWTFSPEGTAEWRAAYGIDFAPLVESSRRSPWKMHVSPRRLSSLSPLTAPLEIMTRDLGALQGIAFSERVRAKVIRDGVIDGVGLYFAATLGPGLTLHTDPSELRDDNHWDHLLWGLGEPLTVRAGDVVEVVLSHRNDGVPIQVRIVDP